MRRGSQTGPGGAAMESDATEGMAGPTTSMEGGGRNDLGDGERDDRVDVSVGEWRVSEWR